MQHLRVQYNVIIPVCRGKVVLNYFLDITETYKPLDILRNEHLRPDNVNNLFHPHIQLSPGLLGRQVISPPFPIVQDCGVETFPFTRNAEILTRKSSRYNIYVGRKNPSTVIVHLDKINYAGQMIYLRIDIVSRHIFQPCLARFLQNITSEDCPEDIAVQQNPIFIELMMNPFRVGYRVPVADESALQTDIHTPTTGEKGQDPQ